MNFLVKAVVNLSGNDYTLCPQVVQPEKVATNAQFRLSGSSHHL